MRLLLSHKGVSCLSLLSFKYVKGYEDAWGMVTMGGLSIYMKVPCASLSDKFFHFFISGTGLGWFIIHCVNTKFLAWPICLLPLILHSGWPEVNIAVNSKCHWSFERAVFSCLVDNSSICFCPYGMYSTCLIILWFQIFCQFVLISRSS